MEALVAVLGVGAGVLERMLLDGVPDSAGAVSWEVTVGQMIAFPKASRCGKEFPFLRLKLNRGQMYTLLFLLP